MPRSRTRQTAAPAPAATPAQTAPQTASRNPLAGLRSVAQASAPVASSRSSVAIIDAPSQTISDAIVKWNDAYEREKQAISDREEAEGVMQPPCDELRTNRCIAAGAIVSSIKVKATNGDTVMFQRAARCCKIKARVEKDGVLIADNEAKLLAAAGSDFDSLFKLKTNLKIDGEKLAALPNAAEVTRRLLETIQQLTNDGIIAPNVTILEDETEIVPTEQYYLARLGLGMARSNPALKGKCDDMENNGLVKPIEPSFKN